MSYSAGRFTWAGRKGTSLGTPHVIEVLVGKSTILNPGDVLVMDVGSTWTSGVPVARPLLSGDTITTSNGIIGVAPYAMTTNSSGNVITNTYPITVDNKGRITTQLPSIPSALPSDPVTGYTRIWIQSFDPTNLFAAVTQTSDIANFYDLSRALGIVASAASAPANYTLDDDAGNSNAPVICEYVNTDDPQFNSANGGGVLFVAGRSQFYQRNTGGFFNT
jgi:hypothetical protein